MPYTQLHSRLIFIKLEPFKPVYGAWKEENDKKFIFIRKIDYSSLLSGDWDKFSKNFTENQDWYIPIKEQKNFNWNDSALTIKLKQEERPWLSWLITPANQLYLMKTRLSASGVVGYEAGAMALMNPVHAAGLWFVNKQRFKYAASKGRGEQSPSMIPKVFARKCWFVDLENYKSYEYVNYLLTNNLV
ncbi:hypothetical protein FM036_41790 [Nostoc sp. HG1]|nr:hypothetical protein [Nostoc sp. HG1]